MQMAVSRTSTQKHSKETPTRREQELEALLDLERLPRHVAVIPDGNGRWAKTHGLLDRTQGHEAGIESIRVLIESCARLHLPALTVYAFGRDNWGRPRHETSTLMRFFRKFLVAERARLEENDIRLVHSGHWADLPAAVLKEFDHTMELTANNQGMVLNLAVSYSGRMEILTAVQTVAQKVADGLLKPEEITPEVFETGFYHPELGDPDLLIRTSGEHRISDFLIYQIRYTEFYFPEVLWPDFRREHLLEALVAFQSRDRRYGKVKE